jgi:hypothetical protein
VYVCERERELCWVAFDVANYSKKGEKNEK